MSLKGSHIDLSVEEIKRELRELGFSPVHLGSATSYDGSYKSSFAVEVDAFNYVCRELYETRKELQSECKMKRRWKRISVFLGATCLALSLLAFLFCRNTSSLQQSVSTLNESNLSLENEVRLVSAVKDSYIKKLADAEDDRDYYKKRLSAIEDEYDFFHNHAVIVTTAGEQYHRYDCYHTDGRRFYIYNIENAIHKGYDACLDCIE